MPKRLNTSDIGAGTCGLLWRRPLVALLLLLPSFLPAQTRGPSGPSLRLVEKGRFLELPPDVFNGLSETTVEAWVKWNAFGNRYQRIFNYGEGGRDLGLTTQAGTTTLWFVIATPADGLQLAKAEGAVRAGEWTHVAGVAGAGGMKLHVNGALVATNPYTGCFNSLGPGCTSRLGQTVTANVDDTPFDGSLAEVRVWKVARSTEQIRDTLAKALTGIEDGLAALWNFSDPQNPGRDASPNGHHGHLTGSTEVAPPNDSEIRVLTLNGNGSSLELPPAMFQGLNAATFECWAKWESFAGNQHVFEFDAARRVKVGNSSGTADLELLAAPLEVRVSAVARPPVGGPGKSPTPVPPEPAKTAPAAPEKADTVRQQRALRLKEWHHLAVAFDGSGTRLYLDGGLVGSASYTGGLATVAGPNRHLVGACSVHPSNTFLGKLKEVRLWRAVRSAEQIRENFKKELTGSEPGLVGLWNFADPAQPGLDASRNGNHGQLTAPPPPPPPSSPPAAAGQSAPPFAGTANRALQLDGAGSYIELPTKILDELNEVTVEGWVKWESFGPNTRFFDFGNGQRQLNVATGANNGALDMVVQVPPPLAYLSAPNAVPLHGWCHIAAVAGKMGMQLYLNGTLLGTDTYAGPFLGREGNRHAFLGESVERTRQPASSQAMHGGMDEVRVWKVSRTAPQIRESFLKQLTGHEPGLVALWNFDDPVNPGRDASPNHHDGKLMGNARPASAAGGSAAMGTVTGRITDGAGRPVRGVDVRVMRGEQAVSTMKSDENGEYFLLFAHTQEKYRVLASLDNLEAIAERQFVADANSVDLTMRDTLRISGALSGPDGQPRRGVKVEAVSADGTMAAFSVSDTKGRFILRRLPDGEVKLRAAGVEIDGGKSFAVNAEAPLADLKLTLSPAAVSERSPSENRALTLDGSGAHFALPVRILGNLRETTIEAWVRFDSLQGLQRYFSYGSMLNDVYLGTEQTARDLSFGAQRRSGGTAGQYFKAGDVLEKGRWCHIAVVFDSGEKRLYFNGALAATSAGTFAFSDLAADSPAYIGRWSDAGSGFTGGVDEFRVWAAVRTGDEIRATMFHRLSGREEGLAALWNFDDPDKPERDATPNGFDGEIVQNAGVMPASLPSAAREVAVWASFSGATVDVDGRPLGKVKVRVERGDEHFDAETDSLGSFSLFVRGSREPWRVLATRGDLSSIPSSVVLDGGEHTLALKLRDAAPLSGHVRAPDGSPLPTIVVQALPIVQESSQVTVPGLLAEMFNTQRLTNFPVIPEATEPALQRVDSLLDFPLVNNSVSGGDAKVTPLFYARWSGRIHIDKGDDYAFHQEEAEDLDQKGFIPDLQRIHGAGKHLLALINDILDLSKIEAGKMTLFLEDFDVAKIIAEVAATVQPLVAKNGNRLIIECAPGTGAMRADLTKVRQTLFNILSNACKFTERGIIKLEVRTSNQYSGISNHSEPTGEAGDPNGPTLITFRVADTGIGMTPEQMGRLFQAFEQADASTTKKFGGTGLGLAISKKFCQLMGGDITVESEAGQGTAFTVTLPTRIAEKPADTLSDQSDQSERSGASGPSAALRPTVLVIDDDPAVRDLVQRSLSKDGYRVLTAADGVHGLALAIEQRPCVITLDVMMPGMDGWAVLTALKAKPATADIPVVMMTIVDDKNLGFALGAADYFTKPIDWHRLAGALKKHSHSGVPQTVLVIEDDANTREMLRRSLEKESWMVTEAENGRCGLERLAERMPALILLDLMMPEMDGFGFMQELRARPDCRSIPVIVITAKHLTDDDRRRLNGEVARILQKGTTSTEDLLAEIRSLLPTPAMS